MIFGGGWSETGPRGAPFGLLTAQSAPGRVNRFEHETRSENRARAQGGASTRPAPYSCSDRTSISPSSRAFIASVAAWAPAAVVK